MVSEETGLLPLIFFYPPYPFGKFVFGFSVCVFFGLIPLGVRTFLYRGFLVGVLRGKGTEERTFFGLRFWDLAKRGIIGGILRVL